MAHTESQASSFIREFSSSTTNIAISASEEPHAEIVGSLRGSDEFETIVAVDYRDTLRNNAQPWELVGENIVSFNDFITWGKSLDVATLVIFYNLREASYEHFFSVLHSGLDDLAGFCRNLHILVLAKGHRKLSSHLQSAYTEGSSVLSYCYGHEVYDFDNHQVSSCDIAIICALHKPELEKVRATGKVPWAKLEDHPDDPTSYYHSAYQTNRGGRLHVVAAAPSQMGMPATAILATKMIRRFRPRLVAMIGIAAGARRNDQGFGDILAPDVTFDYGSGKLEGVDEKLYFRPDPSPISVASILRNRLKEWVARTDILHQVREQWPASKPPTALRLHVGPLGSGSSVIANEASVAIVRDHWRKVLGLEMEAYGAHLACQEAIHPAPLFLCMKSVCDFADSEKSDDWQHYAAYTAAKVFHEFIAIEWERLVPTM